MELFTSHEGEQYGIDARFAQTRGNEARIRMGRSDGRNAHSPSPGGLGRMRTILRGITDELPMPLAWAFRGALACGSAGALAGLIVGLIAYPPTAWFAVFELGIPATIAGTLLGLGTGSVTWLLGATASGRGKKRDGG